MAALDNIISELLKSANEADLNYKKTRDQTQLDKAVRLRRIVENISQLTIGDMDKSVYDTDDDGVVDASETVRIVVRNSTGSTLNKGSVVYLSEATGNRPNAFLAKANAEATSSKTIGIVVANIANNADGYVAVSGTLHDLDTSAFSAGNSVWLSATVAGGWTTTVPTEPNHSVFIGYIARSHPTQGRLVIAIQNGYELNELHDVVISSAANNDLLRYNFSLGYWENQPISTIFGGTPLVSVPTLDQVSTAGYTTTNPIIAGQYQIYGTTRNARLSSDNVGGFDINYNIGGTPDWRWFGGGTTALTTFKANGNVLIGTTTDAGYKLDVAGNTRVNGGNTTADTPFIINNRFQFRGDGVLSYGAASAHGRLNWDASGAYFYGLSGYGVGLGANGVLNHLFINTSGNVGIGTTSPIHNLVVNGNTGITISAGGLVFPNIHRDSSDGGMLLRSWDGSVFSNSVKITPGGNVLIGTTTSSGYKLDVVGTVNGQGIYSRGANIGMETQIAALGTSGSYRAGYYLGSTNTNYVGRLGMNVTNGDAYISLGNTTTLTDVMYFKSSGNIGIGTTSPGRKLSIADATVYMSLTSTSNRTYSIGSDAYGFVLYDDTVGSYRMIVGSTGNILIGTITDSGYKLDINGNLRVQNIPAGSSSNGKFLVHASNSAVEYRTAAQMLSDIDVPGYVSSRGENLVTNGTGLRKSNYNFSAFTFVGSDAYYTTGSFRDTVYSSAPTTDEAIPVDVNQRYRLTVSARQNPYVGARYYIGVSLIDADGLPVNASHHMYKANTLTTLAAPLNPGDTVVYLTSAANWENGGTAGVNTHLRSFIFWNYTNSLGYTFPALTYSRNWHSNMWDPGAVDTINNTITLRVPWPNSTVPAGTQLSNGSSGGTYKYITAANVQIPNAWTTYTGIISGVDTTGTNVTDKFAPGTAAIKILFLNNRDVAGATIYYTNVQFALDTQNPADQILNQNAVVQTANFSISGTGYIGTRLGIGTSSSSVNLAVLHPTNTIAALIGGGTATPAWVGIGTVNTGALPTIQGYNNAVNVANTISLNPSGGNVLIGTATDAGYKLDVTGTLRSTGQATLAGLLAQRSDTSENVITISQNGAAAAAHLYSLGDGYLGWVGHTAAVSRRFAFESALANSGRNFGLYIYDSAGSNPTQVFYAIKTHLYLGNTVNTNGSITAASAVARGVYISNTLVAAANNDVLVGLDIAPTFTNGAFTGISRIPFRAYLDANSWTRYHNNIGSNYHTFEIRNDNAAGSGFASIQSQVQTRINYMQVYTPADSNTLFGVTRGGWAGNISENVSGMFFGTVTAADVIVGANNTATMRIFNSTRNVVFQNGGTFTDAGYRLDVNGTARIQSSLTVTSLSTNGPVKSLSGTLVSVAGYTGLFTVPTNPPGMQTLDIQDGIIVNIL